MNSTLKSTTFIPANAVVHCARLEKGTEQVWYSVPEDDRVYVVKVNKTAGTQDTWEYSYGY